MKGISIDYYTIKPEVKKDAPSNLFYHEQKGELYLSANLRLCSSCKNAHIESLELAQLFVEAIMPTLQRRYGNDFDLRIVKCGSSENKKIRENIQKESEIIRKRIATGNFASNVAP